MFGGENYILFFTKFCPVLRYHYKLLATAELGELVDNVLDDWVEDSDETSPFLLLEAKYALDATGVIEDVLLLALLVLDTELISSSK